MVHVVELAALLLLLCIGHGVVDVSPRPVRRIARSYALWVAGLGIVIAIFAIPALVVWVVRLAVVLAVVFAFRWFWGEAVAACRGPHLIPEPSRNALREAVHEVTGFPYAICQRIVRPVLREYHPHIALLGLTRLNPADGPEAEAFPDAWRQAANQALEEVRDLAAHLDGDVEGPGNSNGMLLIAQALSLYEAPSVRRAVEEACSAGKHGRGARKAVVAWLGKSGKPSDAAKSFLTLNGGETEGGQKAEALTVAGVLWPAGKIARAGFRIRGTAFAIAVVLLAAYGAFALSMHRASGWVYLAVALFIQIEAVFAIGDFTPPAGESGNEDSR